MGIVDRIELLDGLCETDEGKGKLDIRRCYLVDLQNPFEKFDDCEFQTRFRFSKIAVRRLFDIVGNDHELEWANNAVPGMLQLLLCLRFYAKGHFQQTDGDLMGISRQTAGTIIHRISRCIARKRKNFISFSQDLRTTKSEF